MIFSKFGRVLVAVIALAFSFNAFAEWGTWSSIAYSNKAAVCTAPRQKQVTVVPVAQSSWHDFLLLINNTIHNEGNPQARIDVAIIYGIDKWTGSYPWDYYETALVKGETRQTSFQSSNSGLWAACRIR